VSGRREPVVTIDGPAGAGKSTVAREVARRLGFKLVDTGALYRALAWAIAQAGVDPSDDAALAALLARTRVELADGRVLVNGKDVSEEIRAPEIGMLTSKLTALPLMREKMTPIQRSLAAAGGVVLEGRDTGSIVCPDAEVKIYRGQDLPRRGPGRARPAPHQ
jgi:cytidylate kinase